MRWRTASEGSRCWRVWSTAHRISRRPAIPAPPRRRPRWPGRRSRPGCARCGGSGGRGSCCARRSPRAAPCSLNQRTGPHRRIAVVQADAAALRAAVHEHGATTNDAILVAASGALGQVLAARGESVDTIVLTVPVSGRRSASVTSLGNMVSPLLVPVLAAGDPIGRLQQVAAYVRAHKAEAAGPAPIAVLGWLFRALAALGGYRWYMYRQHRLHSLVSHGRGPVAPFTFGGCPIVSAIPVSVGEAGNGTVYFQVLSYAGTVTISVLADPDHFPELNALARALRAELDLISPGCATRH